MPHLFVDISSHGLGHLAQTAPVLNALRDACPTLRLTLRSGLPRERLARRIAGPFEHLPEASDVGFRMRNALDVDLPASAARYRQLHADWPERVTGERDRLAALGPDAVLTDVAYLPLAGAAAAGIPALSLCSLNWADLFQHYFGTEPWAPPIHAQMLAAYRSATAFLRTTPGMAMEALENRITIGPVAARVAADRQRLAAHLGLPLGRRWVLVALGGFDLPLPVAAWPRRQDIAWLVPGAWSVRRDDVFGYGDDALFADLLASADALVAKPGYGTFVEAAIHGVPLLYLRRPGWPEEPCLLDWLHGHGRAAELARADALAGRLLPALDRLWALPAAIAPEPTGVAEAAARLLDHLGC